MAEELQDAAPTPAPSGSKYSENELDNMSKAVNDISDSCNKQLEALEQAGAFTTPKHLRKGLRALRQKIFKLADTYAAIAENWKKAIPPNTTYTEYKKRIALYHDLLRMKASIMALEERANSMLIDLGSLIDETTRNMYSTAKMQEKTGNETADVMVSLGEEAFKRTPHFKIPFKRNDEGASPTAPTPKHTDEGTETTPPTT